MTDFDPQSHPALIEDFIRQTLHDQQHQLALVAVSGGIDSAVVLSLCVRALGAEQVHACLLPFAKQDMADAQQVIAWNQLPAANLHRLPIDPLVQAFKQARSEAEKDQMRFGNAMARSRMMLLYDLARQLSALVVGTENKSEKYLGYFTRFGDAASDLEPIQHLYKTQVRKLASALQLPAQILAKTPSAGLWDGQTDEHELGFSYQQADAVLELLIDQQLPIEQIRLADVPPEVVQKVADRVSSQAFKLQVPYHLAEG